MGSVDLCFRGRRNCSCSSFVTSVLSLIHKFGKNKGNLKRRSPGALGVPLICWSWTSNPLANDLDGGGRLWQIHKAQCFILRSAPFFVSLPGQDFNRVRDLGYLWSHLYSLSPSLQSSLNLSTASPEGFCDYLHQFSPGLSSQPLTNVPGSNLHSLQFIIHNFTNYKNMGISHNPPQKVSLLTQRSSPIFSGPKSRSSIICPELLFPTLTPLLSIPSYLC